MGSNREEELRRGDFHSLNFDFCHFLKAPDLPNDVCCIEVLFKGILHQKIFYCPNLIFWIIMGCGIARFGRKGLKTTET